MKTQKIAGQESWALRTKEVELAVTRQGGHMAPVRFRLGRRWAEPFSIAPWTLEKPLPGLPPLMQALRGDFFCMPFGGNESPYRGEKHPAHGETANAAWKLEKAESHELRLSLKTTIRPGRVDKTIRLVPGQSALYLRHTLSGMKGPMSFGYHPILHLPKAGAGRISVSPFRFGQVFPGAFENPALGGYSALKRGARFTSLRRVRQADDGVADLSVYPAREGYEDLALLASDPRLPFAWTALTIAEERSVWLSLKNPRLLASTIFWMSNGGRHYAPWSGRHRHRLGLEEVTSYFHCGLAESARPNSLSRAGVPTHLNLDPQKPLEIPYIILMAEVPAGFDEVREVRPAPNGKEILLIAKAKKSVRVPVDLSFLLPEPR